MVKANDGHIEPYNKKFIVSALLKDENFLVNELKRSNGLTEDIAKNIANRVTRTINKMEFDNEQIISSDTIRGLVNTYLIKMNFLELTEISELVGIKFIDLMDIWQGNAFSDNANMNSKAPEAQHKYIADAISKKGIMRLFSKEVQYAHLTGRLHIHDADFFATRPFCNEHDLRFYFYYGMYADGTGDNIPVASPAQNAEVAILHAAKALGSAQQFFAGGQGAAFFLTMISPYLEGKSYGEIKQLMQMYIWEMSQMLSRGSQACFSTTQLTPGIPDIFKNTPCVYKGKIHDGIQAPLRTYGEFERENRLAFQAYIEIMLKGDMFGRPFSFPKTELEVLDEHFNKDNWEETFEDALSYKDLWIKVCELICKDGSPYIHNSLGIPKHSIKCYSCCAFEFASSEKSDPEFMDKVNFKDGKHFILGSLQVVTLNLPQAAYESEGDINKFMEYCKETINMSIEIFKLKQQLMNKQSLTFAKQTPIDLNDSSKHAPPLWSQENLPCCIGIVGLNEAVQVMSKHQIHERNDSYKLGVKILTLLQFTVKEVSIDSNIKIAFARTPAETTAQRFAVCDFFNEKYSEIAKTVIKGNLKDIDMKSGKKDLPIYYTNGAMLSNDADVTIWEKIRLEEHAFSAFDGGNIFHFFLGENDPEPEGILSVMDKMLHNTNIKYFAFTKDYTICRNCNHFMQGLKENCDLCNSDDITQFSRITGYIQAVKSKNISGWNNAKREELKNRFRYDL